MLILSSKRRKGLIEQACLAIYIEQSSAQSSMVCIINDPFRSIGGRFAQRPSILCKIQRTGEAVVNAANVQNKNAINEYPHIVIAGKLKGNGRSTIQQISIFGHGEGDNRLHAKMEIALCVKHFVVVLVKRHPGIATAIAKGFCCIAA